MSDCILVPEGSLLERPPHSNHDSSGMCIFHRIVLYDIESNLIFHLSLEEQLNVSDDGENIPMILRHSLLPILRS